jgi:hypothetical protein
MRPTCTVSRLANGKWQARQTGSPTGQVEVTATTREEALTKMRDELQHGIEWCPCSGAWGGMPWSFRCGRKEAGHERPVREEG